MNFEEGLSRLQGRTRIATWLLWALVAASALATGGQLLEALGVVDIEASADPLTLAVALGYVAYLPIFLITVIVVAMWIHRAHANLHDAGIDGLEFTPGWAVGWYFVPFANLVKPFQAMRELWNASHMRHDPFGGEAPTDLKLWWGAWIVGNILSNAGTRMATEPTGDMLAAGNAIGAAGSLITGLAAVLLIRIIHGVNAAQRSGTTAATIFA
jgi:hypothetical protein